MDAKKSSNVCENIDLIKDEVNVTTFFLNVITTTSMYSKQNVNIKFSAHDAFLEYHSSGNAQS